MPCPVIIKDVSSNSKWECVQRPTARKYAERKLVISIRSLPLEVWESHGREGENIVGVRGMEDTNKQGPDGPINRDCCGKPEPYMVYTRFIMYILCILAWCSVELITVGTGLSLILLSALGTFFFLQLS